MAWKTDPKCHCGILDFQHGCTAHHKNDDGSTSGDDSQIECPACGEMIGELWDYGDKLCFREHDEGEGEVIQCPSCDAEVSMTWTVTVNLIAKVVSKEDIANAGIQDV